MFVVIISVQLDHIFLSINMYCVLGFQSYYMVKNRKDGDGGCSIKDDVVGGC